MSFRLATDAEAISIPEPKPCKNRKQQPQPEPTEAPRIQCGAISSCGQKLALCDDQKQMTLWVLKDKWTLEKQWNLQRRATQVIFDEESSEDALVVADKTGDAFVFKMAEKEERIETDPEDAKDEEDGEGDLLLGHLSMLLGVALAKREEDGKRFVVTCDRDEKIRVSRYPNAYNIHNFCLGHEEFVTRYLSQKKI